MNRPFAFVVIGCALGASACAHGQVVETVSSQRSTQVVTAPAAPPAPAPVVDVPLPRPRLSQTVTLGEGSDPAYVPSAPPTVAAAPASPTVVVNNTVVVQNGGYGYGGYGYGGYGYGGYGGARGRAPDARSSSGSQGPSAWSTTGWEGARRTAAPGQTPGVGGNWSPPPSYGPTQMK